MIDIKHHSKWDRNSDPYSMEINVMTLHKVVETIPQQMRLVIKAKGGPTKY